MRIYKRNYYDFIRLYILKNKEGGQMRLISIEMLEDNMILATDVRNNDILILKKGLSNIRKHVKKLRNMGISHIYIADSICEDIMVPDVISEDTRKLCKDTLIKTMNTLTKHDSLELGLFELNISIEHIINDIVNNNDVKISLADIRTTDEYTFSHCVSTTVYSLLIGRSLNYDRKKLESLAMGTMLHDIGKISLDRRILYKKEKLTSDELHYVKQHALIGYNLIQDCSDLSEASKNIVLNHHERLNGSGYPYGLKGNQIDEYSKIVGIADVYDALTADRCYRKKWKTNEALKYLIENSGTLFDAELVRIFMQQIAIFPNGTIVRLSDGRLALVKKQNKNFPLRPIIRVFADRWGDILPAEEIDLMEVLSLTIVDSELEIKNCKSWVSLDI